MPRKEPSVDPEQMTASFLRASRAGLPKQRPTHSELNTHLPMLFTWAAPQVSRVRTETDKQVG